MQLLKEEKIFFEIVITKTDKTNQKELHKNITALQKTYEEYFKERPNLLMTSSAK